MSKQWMDDLATIRVLAPDIPEIQDAVLRLWKLLEHRPDWNADLHEQYLKVLDEIDKLQEIIDHLEEKLVNHDCWCL